MFFSLRKLSFQFSKSRNFGENKSLINHSQNTTVVSVLNFLKNALRLRFENFNGKLPLVILNILK
jgi:hypothetical protein